MKGLGKKRFLRALEISLLLFIALFFITASIQAQSYNNFPYNYDNFNTFNSWFPSYSMNFQNNYGYVGQYGQDWGITPFAFTEQTGGYLMPGNFGAYRVPQSSFASAPSFQYGNQVGNYYGPQLGNNYNYGSGNNYSMNDTYAQMLAPSGPSVWPYWFNDDPYSFYGPDSSFYTTYSYNPHQPLQSQYEVADVNLRNGDDGEKISMDKGETLSIVLTSHLPDYRWYLDTDEFDDDILVEKSQQDFPGYDYGTAAGEPVLYGGHVGGHEQWIFKAIDTGTTIIKLEHIRSSDGEGKDTFEIEVEVD